MQRIFGKGAVLWKMGLVMALVAMVIVCPLSRATLQAQTEKGGGTECNAPATGALNSVIDWIEPDDGSIGAAVGATAKAVVSWPLVGVLALWSHVEHTIGLECH
jgi:hypothetical protein